MRPIASTRRPFSGVENLRAHLFEPPAIATPGGVGWARPPASRCSALTSPDQPCPAKCANSVPGELRSLSGARVRGYPDARPRVGRTRARFSRKELELSPRNAGIAAWGDGRPSSTSSSRTAGDGGRRTGQPSRHRGSGRCSRSPAPSFHAKCLIERIVREKRSGWRAFPFGAKSVAAIPLATLVASRSNRP